MIELPTLSIGQLARQTGLSEHTLRIWERRYGRPSPLRRESGHRRYSLEEAHHLSLIAQAVSRGLRPGTALKLSHEEIKSFLQPTQSTALSDQKKSQLIRWICQFDENKLLLSLKTQLKQLDTPAFLDDYLGPLITEVGHQWENGRLEIRHEHFFSHLAYSFLESQSSLCQTQKGQAGALLTTLSGEEHDLGLMMARLYLAARGHSIFQIGAQAPVNEIVQAASETSSSLVLVSVSLYSSGQRTNKALAQLREGLPPHSHLLIGGRGVSRMHGWAKGIHCFDQFKELGNWLDQQDFT